MTSYNAEKLREKDYLDKITDSMACPCLPPGRTLLVLNTCLSERREEGGLSSAFTTGSSSTYKKSWDTSTTKATASMQIHLRYDVMCFSL